MPGLLRLLQLLLVLATASLCTFFVGVLPALHAIDAIYPTGNSTSRFIDSSNLRQIGQASLIYALDHGDESSPRHLLSSGELGAC